MTPVELVDTTGMTHEEWVEARNSLEPCIGGSDIGTVMGFNKWESPMTLWARKRGQIDPIEDNEPMYVGRLLEPVLREEYERRHDVTVVKPTAIYAHPEHRWLIANPDGLIEDDEILEIKTGNIYGESDWEGDIPDNYLLQGMLYMHVMGRQRCTFFALIGGRFKEHTIGYDAELAEELVKHAARFLEHVDEGTLPDIDGSTSTNTTLKALWDSDGSAIELDYWTAANYVLTRNGLREAEEKKLLAENELKAALGPAEAAIVDGERVLTWKTNKAGVRSLRVAKPFEEYVIEVES